VGRILVVDDEETIRFLLRKVLEQANYKVVEAANGREALEKISDSPDNFDVIVVDLLMPIMGGIEFLEALQVNDNRVPVVVLSASQSHFVKVEKYSPSAFLLKPFDRTQLVSMIHNLTIDSCGAQSS
jgi:CheY-like chemotaxis protein